MIRRILAYPQTEGRDLDDPATTQLRRDVLRQNRFLNQIYHTWYQEIQSALPPVSGAVVELGAGAGFLKSYIPELITTELLKIQGVDAVADGLHLPFPNQRLRAIVMTNVLHHMPRVSSFFQEAERCLTPGGRVIMIEPWLTRWSRWVYSHLHHEPMAPDVTEWSFAASGPLSGANEALPWIVFCRDRLRFEADFSSLRVVRVQPYMPLVYLLSGGFTSRVHCPAFFYPMLRAVERLYAAADGQQGLFAVLVLERI